MKVFIWKLNNFNNLFWKTETLGTTFTVHIGKTKTKLNINLKKLKTMKTKLKLQDLKVTSFVTDLAEKQKMTVVGGVLFSAFLCDNGPNPSYERGCTVGDGATCVPCQRKDLTVGQIVFQGKLLCV